MTRARASSTRSWRRPGSTGSSSRRRSASATRPTYPLGSSSRSSTSAGSIGRSRRPPACRGKSWRRAAISTSCSSQSPAGMHPGCNGSFHWHPAPEPSMRILICATEAPLPPVNGFRRMLTAVTSELRREHDIRVLAFRAPDQVRASTDESLRLLPQPEDAFPASVMRTARAVARGDPSGPTGWPRRWSSLCGPSWRASDRRSSM